MKTLRIEVDEAGTVRVSVDGSPIGLIEELKLVAGMNGKVGVNITFCNLNKLADVFNPSKVEESQEVRQRLLDSIERYHKLVADLPFVEVFDRADTLPTGMPAVRTED